MAKNKAKACNAVVKAAAGDKDVDILAGDSVPTAKKGHKKRRASKKKTRVVDDNAEPDNGKKKRPHLGLDCKKTKKPRIEAQKLSDQANPRKIFVGGLERGVTREHLRNEFGKCGKIERLDLPFTGGQPSGMAFIYFEDDEGVAAALMLSGSQFQGRKIKVRSATRTQENKQQYAVVSKSKGTKKRGKDEDTTVFVGGLSYDTEEQVVKSHFSECGEIKSVRMVRNSERMFKGIAFIVFTDETGVQAALAYNGDQYGGRTIRVCRASEDSDGKGCNGKGVPGKDSRNGKGNGRRTDGECNETKPDCYAFREGRCPFGDSCHFAHVT